MPQPLAVLENLRLNPCLLKSLAHPCRFTEKEQVIIRTRLDHQRAAAANLQTGQLLLAGSAMLTGVIAALLAALAWSLNFIVPFVIGDYSIFDFALFRFLISGLLGFCFLSCNLKA